MTRRATGLLAVVHASLCLSAAHAQPLAPAVVEQIRRAIAGCPIGAADCAAELRIIVTIEKTSGAFAKATVRLASGLGETDTAYLRNTGGGWQVLDFGTGIDPSRVGVPKDVW